MPTLKYWDGAAWTALLGTIANPDEVQVGPSLPALDSLELWVDTATDPLPTNMSRFADRVQAVGTQALTTTPTLIAGLSIIVPVTDSTERFLVIGSVDMVIGSAASGTNAVGTLYIDGVGGQGDAAAQAIFNSNVTGARNTATQSWQVVGLSPGNHTFELRGSCSSGTTATAYNHSSLNVVSLGPSPSTAQIPPGSPLCCQIGANADQSVANVTTTVVVMSTTVYDNAANYGLPAMADLANNQIKIPVDGWYRFSTCMSWISATVGYRACLVRKNGSDWVANQYVAPASGQKTVQVFTSEPQFLVAGDTLQLVAIHSQGTALSITQANRSAISGGYSTLSVEMVPAPSGISGTPAQNDTGWISFTPIAPVTIASGSSPAYRKVNGRVQLRGNFQNVPAGAYTTIFVLPVGFRPVETFYFACQGNTNLSFMSGQMGYGGNIGLYSTAATSSYFSIGNVSFIADN